MRLQDVDEHREHFDDTVEIPGRASATPQDAHVVDILRRAVTPPAARPDRAEVLTEAARRRAQRRRHRRQLAGSAAVTAAVLAAVFGVGAGFWSPRPADGFATNTGPGPADSPSPSFTMAPMPMATGVPTSPMEYLTLSEVRSVFPDAVPTESTGENGDFRQSETSGLTWSAACGGDTTLEGIAPVSALQMASWGTLSPQPPDANGGVRTRRVDQLSVNMNIFHTAAEAEEYAKVFAASATDCATEAAAQAATSTLDPSTPVAGTLGTGAKSLFTYGYFDGAWSIDAVVVRGPYAVRASATVPAPETDQGYVDAARATAGLATIAAERAAASNLP